ncbi:hypothetical protein [Nonomuraea typhae]|uniref:hypothetical protein n=1 Tax=Nonomuraea typhae TaxID=2603600 RepID=UPI0015E24D8C|nr:hypothetical protein [Nonomuraea typhae]
MSRWKWIVLVVVAVLGLTTGGVAWAYPSVAATACPGCYGLHAAAPGIYLEKGADPAHALSTVSAATRLVESFYGRRRSSPRILICTTPTCYTSIGGGREKGIAVLNQAVMLSPEGLDPVIAAHELSHVELHARLSGEVPQWFDEGLAVVVSNDPRYLKPTGDRCLAEPSAPLPKSLPDWLRAASADPNTYAKAACQVSRWLTAHGGRDGVLRLIDALNAGQPFTTAADLP